VRIYHLGSCIDDAWEGNIFFAQDLYQNFKMAAIIYFISKSSTFWQYCASGEM
jgi:hypothetical protein